MTARPKHPRLSAEARRQSIVEGARRVIAAKGLTAISVRDIAAETGVSIGTITHHFAGIAEILDGVLQEESAALRGQLDRSIADRASALDGLDRLGDAYLVDEPRVRAFWALWLASCSRAPYDPQLAAWLADRYAAWRAIVRGLLVEGLDSGEFAGVDPDALAVEIVALLDGYGIQALLDPGAPDPAQARAALRRILRARLARA